MSSDQSVDQNASELMVASVAYDNGIVPLRLLGEVLVVATAAPLTKEAQERICFILNRKIRGVIRSAEYIAARQREIYDQQPESSDDIGNVTWYWPHWHWFADDELHIKCSGWNGGGIHWSGCQVLKSDHPDYNMWRWVISIRSFHRLIEDSEVVGIRRIWNRYLSRCGATPDGAAASRRSDSTSQ